MEKKDAQQAPYPLRIPKELREALERAAEHNARSLNAEITARLSQSNNEVDDLRKELARQTALAEERRQAGELMGSLTRALAEMVTKTAAMLSPERRKSHPEIEVFEAIADGVVRGSGAAMAEALREWAGGKPASAKDPKPIPRRSAPGKKR